MSRISQRLPKRRVFLGCEGESERSYGAFLAQLMIKESIPVHLNAVLLKPGGGDPLTLIKRAETHLLQNADRPYEVSALILDSDLKGLDEDRDKKAFKLAKNIELDLIWQIPCHEALLLRHISGCETKRPTTKAAALRELKKQWLNYDKNMPASKLLGLLTYKDVLRAASVEADLNKYLTDIGFM